MKKRAIVTDTRRPAQAGPQPPHPLVGARFLAGAAESSQLPAQGLPEIAFAGRSNAGKSSAINALANHGGLAYASRTPGRTQQINFFTLRSGALVADLPGYGYAAVAKSVKRSWQEFLWQYVATRDNLVALVLLVDARRGLTDLDLAVLAQFVPSGRPALILATKADKLGVAAQREAIRHIGAALQEAFPLGVANVTVQAFSATTRQGVADAETTIASWLPEAAPKERPRGQGE